MQPFNVGLVESKNRDWINLDIPLFIDGPTWRCNRKEINKHYIDERKLCRKNIEAQNYIDKRKLCRRKIETHELMQILFFQNNIENDAIGDEHIIYGIQSQ